MGTPTWTPVMLWAHPFPQPLLGDVPQPNSRALTLDVNWKEGWSTKADNHQQQPLNQKEYSTLHLYQLMYLICVYILNQNEHIYILRDGSVKISSTKCKYCTLLLQFIGLPLVSNSSWSAIIQVQFWFQNWACGRQYYKSFVRYTLG